MSTLRVFLGNFGLFFVFAALLQWGRRVSLGGNAAVFVGPNNFKELSEFEKPDQERLLQAADRKAFPGWSFLFPTLVYAAIFAGGVALAQTLSYSFWVSTSFAAGAMALGIWIGRLEARRIRPYLLQQIERTHPAEP